MSVALLRQCIRLAIRESDLARVPNQLISPDETDKKDDGKEANDVNEFSGVGGIAGYTGPLGLDPDKMGRKKNKTRK